MTGILAQYDRARAALAEATSVTEVLSIRDEMAHVKLYAQQIRDRSLLADASEFQMRVERRLGILLQAAREAGQIADGRPKKNGSSEEPFSRVTLAEVGVDKKLSMKAQRSASISEMAFEAMVAGMRQRMASGRAIVLDPVDAADKGARDQQRRDDHAARTLGGGCVADLTALAASGFKAGAILADPQWKFQTRSAGGDGRSANLHYKTETIDAIKELPVAALAADDCALFLWMVDWCPRDALELIEAWGFKHVTTAFTWAKQTPSADAWHFGMGYWTRANPEQCWLATRGNPKRLHADVRQLIVAPVMEHSRKPDEIYERIERLVEGPYLELQARRPRQGWTSWGDELRFEMPPHDPETGEVIEPAPASAGEGAAVAAENLASLDAAAAVDLELEVEPEPPAFPPHEFAELLAIDQRKPGYEKFIAPYIARGQAFELSPGYCTLTSAGAIRLRVIERERAATAARFHQHLSADDFAEWQALAAIAGGEDVAGEIVRGLVGRDYATVTITRLFLSDAGRARLASLELLVDRADPPPPPIAARPVTPKQLDLIDLAQGAA